MTTPAQLEAANARLGTCVTRAAVRDVALMLVPGIRLNVYQETAPRVLLQRLADTLGLRLDVSGRYIRLELV